MFTSDQKVLFIFKTITLYNFRIAIFLHNLSHVPVGFTVSGLFMVTRESAVTASIIQEIQLLQ